MRPLLILCVALTFSAQGAAQSIPADFLLNQAQRQLDSSQYAAALESARQAERVLSAHDPPTAGQLAAMHCLVGICLLKNDSLDAAKPYFERVQTYSAPLPVVDHAHVHYFKALYHQTAGQGGQNAAFEEYRQAIAGYERQAGQNGRPHSNLAAAWCNTGVIHTNWGQQQEAIGCQERALAIWTGIYGTRHPSTARAHHNMALALHYQGNNLLAQRHILMALDMRLELLGRRHRETAAAFLQHGLVLDGLGQVERARVSFQEALLLARVTGWRAVEIYAYTNLGMTYSRYGEPKEARRYFQRALEEEKSFFGDSTDEVAHTYFNLATTYQDDANFDSALLLCRKAIEFSSSEYYGYPVFLNGLGLAFEGLGALDSAENYYLKAREYWLDPQNPAYALASMTGFNLANVRRRQGRFAEAIDWNREAQQFIGYRDAGDFGSVGALPNLCDLLSQEAQLFMLAADTPEAMVTASSAFQQAHAAYDYALGGSGQAEREALVRGHHALLEANIRLNLRLYEISGNPEYREAAFALSERSKAFLLLETMRKTGARDPGCMPADSMRLENDWQNELARLDIRYADNSANGMLDTDPRQVEIGLLRVRIEHNLSGLASRYPGCFPQPDLRSSDVREIQQRMLEPDQTMLEYFVGDSAIVIFVLKKDFFDVFSFKKDFPLENWTDSLLKSGIRDYGQKRDARTRWVMHEVYVRYASALYDRLLRPVEHLLTSRLLIVPDGVLGYLPFEALLTARPAGQEGWSTLSFFVEKCSVGYCYSATLLGEMRTERGAPSPSGTLLAIAPFDSDGPAASGRAICGDPLPSSGPEADSAAAIWQGRRLPGGDAKPFWAIAPGYRILHLSTHSQADDRAGDYAWLGFTDPGGNCVRIYARDLYLMTLNPDLVVLSACETGIGRLRRGEGIISLARACTRAGAKSIVTTLWRVSDSSTKVILTDFHRLIRAGKPKDLALQQAKINYLNAQRGSGDGVHPYFWAGLIGIGDPRPLRR